MGSASPFVSLISIEAGAKERIPPWRNGLVLPPGYDYSLTWSIDEGIRNLREREREERGRDCYFGCEVGGKEDGEFN